MSRTLSVVFVATVLLLTSAARAYAEVRVGAVGNNTEYTCYPDTVDPRGPKAK